MMFTKHLHLLQSYIQATLYIYKTDYMMSLQSCLSGICWIPIFQPNFIFFWIFLDLLLSVNIHVIKMITRNLADVWHIIFSLWSYKHFIM